MEGFILVGGKSSRMGTDKAGLFIGGSTMLERAAGALAAIAVDRISVVGGEAGEHSNFRFVSDLGFSTRSNKRAGPMIGVHAAIAAAASEWIAVLACDLPFVSGELLQLLADVDRDGCDAVVPLQSDGIAQPLCALYRCEPCRSVTERLIKRGELSMRSLIAAIDTRFVPFTDLERLDNSENLFLNVNDPADHARALMIAAHNSPPRPRPLF